MKIKHLLTLSLGLISSFSYSQNYKYTVDLINVNDDKIDVELTSFQQEKDTVSFNFPKTIPGTYATQDYGVYIADFKALDDKGTELTVKKEGNNTFLIFGSKKLSKITYKVNDTWDSDVKKNKIFEPAGTNWEKDKNFVFNNSGVFGFFESKELLPFDITVKKPASIYGLTVLENTASANEQIFKAKNYHELVDCPILFAAPDTVKFKVSNTNVTIGVYAQSGGQYSKKVYEEIKPSMEAISKFVGTLPVDDYSFLIYLSDKKELGTEIRNGITLATIAKLTKVGGLGALEHGNSSFYYLGNFGDEPLPGLFEQMNYLGLMKDVAIHEFMHIFTPLSLHSEMIGNFDYINPKMSKHLWLYEGITEYFSGIIKLQGGIISMDDYFNKTMNQKMTLSNKYPYEKMSFTEMSANVIDKPYKAQYSQVYMRGAVIGMLLDIEIIRLTNGAKTLKDVVIALGKKYGANKSFDEASFIKEFVAEVHPDLQQFFDKYVEGKIDLPMNEVLKNIGVTYTKEKSVTVPDMPYKKKKVKLDKSMAAKISGDTFIKKMKKSAGAPFQKGDKFNVTTINKRCYNDKGEILPEGTVIKTTVKREGKDTPIEFPLVYKQGTKKNVFEFSKNLTKEQQAILNTWIGK